MSKYNYSSETTRKQEQNIKDLLWKHHLSVNSSSVRVFIIPEPFGLFKSNFIFI